MKSVGIVFSNIHDKDINELTATRTLASVPFGGRYRLIDFVLSNMVNSGINNVGVITKYNYQSLMDHIGSGKSWDLSRKNGGLMILPPFGRQASASKVYSSRFEAISNSAYYLRDKTEDYVVMSDCDNVCNIDYQDVIAFHEKNNADITVVYRKKRIPEGEVKNRTRITVDDSSRVVNVTNSAKNSGEINVFVNILVINRQFLLNIIDNADQMEYTSFSRDVLIRGTGIYRIFGYEYKGYFASIDSVANYYKHSMQLLDKSTRDGLFRVPGANVYTNVRDSAPCRIEKNANVKNSLIADGCVIEGDVTGSILFRGVKVAKGAVVRNSVLFQNTEVGENTRLNCVITDRNTKILNERELSGHQTHPSYIPENTII